jgi:hypothetical protein
VVRVLGSVVVVLAVVALWCSGTRAATKTFYLHHARQGVDRGPGILDETAPTGVPAAATTPLEANGTASFPVFVAAPSAGDVRIPSLIVARVHLAADTETRDADTGCADVDAAVVKLDTERHAAQVASGRLVEQVLPRGRDAGFHEFRVEIDVPGAPMLHVGEAIALAVSVHNRCPGARRVTLAYDGVATPARLELIAPDPKAVGCRDAVDGAVARYVSARRRTMRHCLDAIERGILHTRDCAGDGPTATRLAAIEADAVNAMHASCTDVTVIAPPPAGLGATMCGGSDDQCEFTFGRLDDGQRGNANDYVDCLLCLADRATDATLARTNAGAPITTAARPDDCDARIQRAAVVFAGRKAKLLQRCQAHAPKELAAHQCPDEATREHIGATQAKVGARLLAPCARAIGG